ncbi:unnamed protein product, partial [Ascophyllum nodosum]
TVPNPWVKKTHGCKRSKYQGVRTTWMLGCRSYIAA